MLAKLIVKMYGGIWNVRLKYEHANNYALKKFYFLVYSVYNYENASYIDAHATFLDTKFYSWKNGQNMSYEDGSWKTIDN